MFLISFFSLFLLLFSEIIQVSHKPAEEEWPFLLHAQFTPRGHSLIIVYNYDIYYMSGPHSQQAYRITKSASPGHIYNGVPDWLYEGKQKCIRVSETERKKAQKSIVTSCPQS